MKKKQHLTCLNISNLKAASRRSTTSGSRARHKLRVLERDEFKCVHCGSSDCLTIAHTTPPKKKKDRNAGSYKVDDCITLCEECHILFDDGMEEK